MLQTVDADAGPPLGATGHVHCGGEDGHQHLVTHGYAKILGNLGQIISHFVSLL